MICDNSGWHAIQRAQFVTIGIAKIGEIHLAGGPLAHPRRVLDRGAAIRNPGFVPCVGLFGIAHCEANCAAVSLASRLAVNRLGHHEKPAIVAVNQPAPGVLRAPPLAWLAGLPSFGLDTMNRPPLWL